MTITRRSVVQSLASLPLVSLAPLATARAQGGYPVRPVQIINPFPAGSSLDLVARYAADQLRELGQPFIVESVVGAGGTIGTARVIQNGGDGHTLLVHATEGLVSAVFLYKTANYDIQRDLQPIWSLESSGLVAVVRNDLPVNSLQELVDYAKANPGKLTYASAGNGTPQHLAGELFKSKTGTDLVHVPYRGSIPAHMDLMGGHVDCTFSSVASLSTLIADGKVRPLATLGAVRTKVLPNVPTAREAGVEGLEFPLPTVGLYAPASVPPAVVQQIADLLNRRYAADTEGQARMAKLGLFAVVAQDDLAERLQVTMDFYGNLIRELNIQLE